MTLRHFLRMANWARHPPSDRRVKLGAAVIAICLAVALAEWLGLLPDWFALDPKAGR